jgi:hypothetical protein
MPMTPSRPATPEPMTAVGMAPAPADDDDWALPVAVAVLPAPVLVFLAVVKPLAVVVRLLMPPAGIEAEAPPVAEAEPLGTTDAAWAM